jgi:hypothetical protein
VALLTAVRRAFMAGLICAAGAASPGFGQALEYEVKAAFLLNFTRFTEWPAGAFSSASDPFSVCVAGSDGFAPVVERAVQGERVGTHPIAVQRLPQNSGADRCHLLFVPRTVQARAGPLLRAATRALTVGESPGFLEQGGMINFVIDAGRVRFDVNTTAAAMRGLRLRSRLLRLARRTDMVPEARH